MSIRLTGLRRLLLSLLVTGGALLPSAIAWADANSPAPGTVIQNQATGSFSDPDSGIRNIESNIVEVTVAEVAGITVTATGFTEAPSNVANAGPNQGDSVINTEDVVYFTFEITNVGNDPTQFFIPDNASITNGSLNGPIQIIAYDTDGTSTTTLPTPIDVIAGGMTTGAALGLPEGSIAPSGTVTVRVPVKANTGLANNDPLTVVLGDTPTGNSGNQVYSDGGNALDLYTQDNQDADIVDVPTTPVVETEAAGPPINGDTTFRRQEASATQSALVTLVTVLPPVGTGTCRADYNLVYSGQNNQIFAVHVESGASLQLTNTALGATNGLSTDHVNRQVYYGEGNSLFAWSPLTNTHVVVDSNFSSYLSTPLPTNFSLSSGGAAFFGGSVYQGSDIASGGIFEIFKVDFVPGSNGLLIQDVTALGIDTLVQNGTITNSSGGATPNWGDFIIDDNGVITANGNGGQVYWSYDLNTGTFVDLVDSFTTNSQLAKDGQGRLWALGASDVFQITRVGNSINEIPGTRRPTTGPLGAHSSADAAECVRGSSSIGDFVWNDTNANGITDSGEPGIENVTVDLVWDLNGDGVIDANEPVLATRTTDANGAYDFGELIFGNYIINVTDVNGVLAGSTLTTATESFGVTLPVGAIDFNDANFGYQFPLSDPNLLLVKRITAINRGLANEQSFDAEYVDVGSSNDIDNEVNWPGNPTAATIGSGNVEEYITGIADGTANSTLVAPGDEIEYTISFLSNGDVAAQDVLICDRTPTHTTFITDAYNNLTPTFGSGPRGILLNFNGAQIGLTNADDGDETPATVDSDNIGGYYFPAGVEPSTRFPDISCTGPNDNGAIVVELSNIPNATGDGVPANSYGFIRFRVSVD
ncbi:MAG: conserved repeat domain [Phormidesmis priestleyi Ana]|uniref:Conserved repeat domain n=1 Tax=Phormidesmis priestleyi Ana TaxID=1666911 RepID=A0A0P7ZGN5_9CYAN|nr:MAG: conserved repeat domain [Phormidesmis priestleyi Ana]